ncbi:MAG: DUF1203 domain-containing protein [Nitratireductor sp.]
MQFRYMAIPTLQARNLQSGGVDAHGNRPERTTSDGSGNPCRHCLRDIAGGKGMLIAAYTPFASRQPFAETGPIFVCEKMCERHDDTATLPRLFANRQSLLMRGYTADERISYGTGQIIEPERCQDYLENTFANPQIAFVHIRSATNNCFQCRVERKR